MEEIYQSKNKIRILTSGSLFDGHDAAINIMRRIFQSSGAEVIHLGHNRSAQEIVTAAIQEDVQGIAITSYQGGHLEFFKYIYDLLQEAKCGHIKLFGGGGGTILPKEIEELHEYGITKIYSPDDGRVMGLQGMINDVLKRIDYPTAKLEVDSWRKAIHESYAQTTPKDKVSKKLKNQISDRAIARLISAIENEAELVSPIMKEVHQKMENLVRPAVLGITGTGGAGKSSLVDELVRRYLLDFKDKHIAIICVDPSKRKTGGALLGDRIRMNSVYNTRVYMRSMATRQANASLSKQIQEALTILKAAQFDLIILETSGIGQSGSEIVDHADATLYAMTPEFGAATQLEKIDMLDYADIVVLNKFDKQGSQDALRDIKKQYQRNLGLWHSDLESMPVYGTMASQYNDGATNTLYKAIIELLNEKTSFKAVSNYKAPLENKVRQLIIPPARVRYLSEISEEIRTYNVEVEKQAEIAQKMYNLFETKKLLETTAASTTLKDIDKQYNGLKKELSDENTKSLEEWDSKVKAYQEPTFEFQVRDKKIAIETHYKTLSHTLVPKITLPKYKAWGDILRWIKQENTPGDFPYTAGVFPFKRQNEDPTRMFAGEGGPERTNKRFHYVSKGMPAKRLSTAFDSVTLYGQDPDFRPDIYGKIGNAGVSICSLDDAKKLYSGFNLCDPKTSVSMTINGPAATILAFFFNAAIDQQCELYIRQEGKVKEIKEKIKKLYKDNEQPKYLGEIPEGNNGLGLLLLGITGDQVLPKTVYEKIKKETLQKVRGTVQADILKEDQAQNTCIFSTDFSMGLMGDVQQYFVDHNVRNFYSVSISGYHIAEAGANPITQLAFTLANGFTFVEYYLSRGMTIDDFVPNFSFFFSNGIDAEYAVIGRVARKIWAKAMKLKYGASSKAQKLKYHIQTSGRSLHAQEISFNDIRTTLQALYAIYDNCNSLHTNAYDEAITTPTEESVRRAIAIQMIINHELGLTKNENPLQGAFIIEELTDLVEEAILSEFDRITERGGVIGAMETMYQRGKIQEESLYYESLKHNGELPIVGVNTYLSKSGSPTIIPNEVIRSTKEEKEYQISEVQKLNEFQSKKSKEQLIALQKTAIQRGNLFTDLMEITKYCSLGQITNALYEVGGQYRRNM